MAEHLLLTNPIPFRLSSNQLVSRLMEFNSRKEIEWFGLQGELLAPSWAVLRFQGMQQGFLGGGGVAAINGGVIAAGLDGVSVLAAGAQYDAQAVVTLTLQIQFLRLAKASRSLEFRACVTKSARNVCFVQCVLIDALVEPQSPLASATTTLAPI